MIRTLAAELEAEAPAEAEVAAESVALAEDAAEPVALADTLVVVAAAESVAALVAEDVALSVLEDAAPAAPLATGTKVHCLVSSNKGDPSCPVIGFRVIVQVSNIGPWSLRVVH